MSELSFDGYVKVAWRDRAIALGRNLKQMTYGDTLTISQSTDELPGGPHGRVSCSVTRGGLIRATIDSSDLDTDITHINDNPPEVQLMARLAFIDDPAHVYDVINDIGRRHRGISFHVHGDHLHATRVIDCAAFHPANLRNGIWCWYEFLRSAGPGIVEILDPDHTGGRRCDVEIPRLLRELLEETRRRELRPGQAGFACDHDIDLIYDYLRICDREFIAWNDRWAEAKSRKVRGDADDFYGEAVVWERLGRGEDQVRP